MLVRAVRQVSPDFRRHHDDVNALMNGASDTLYLLRPFHGNTMLSRTARVATARLSQLAQHAMPQTRSMAASSPQGTILKLNTGAEIPAVGFGTWQDKDAQENAVTEALKAGFRHIDTARM